MTRWAGWLLAGLVACLFSLIFWIGPLLLFYPPSVQYAGFAVFGLLVMVCAAAGWLWWRWHRAAVHLATLTGHFEAQVHAHAHINELLFELNPKPIFLKDAQGRYVNFNRAWESLTGKRRDDWIGLTAADLAPAELASMYVAQDEELIANPARMVSVETQLITNSGETREVILHKVSLPARTGQTASLMGQIDDVTEVRRTAQALAREQTGLKLVVQAVQGGVWDWDLRSDSIATSARFRQILGFPSIDDPHATVAITMGRLPTLIHPDDLSRVEAALGAHLARETLAHIDAGPHSAAEPDAEATMPGPSAPKVEPQSQALKAVLPFAEEFRLQRADGCYVWVSGHGMGVWNAAGEPERFVGTIADISAQRATIEALRLQENRHALVIEASQAGMFDWDMTNSKTTYSPIYKRIHGYDEDEFVPPTARGALRVHPDDRERLLAAREALFERRVPYDIEYRSRKKDGNYIWLRVCAIALRDEQGKAIRFIGSATDITQRRESAHQLARQGELLARVVESVGAAIWERDLTGKGDGHISIEMLRLLGYPADTPREYISGKNGPMEMIHPDDVDRVIAARDLHFRLGLRFSCDARLRRQDGGYLWCSISGRMSRDTNGVPVRFTGAIIDITERKEKEIELQEANVRALDAAQAKSTFLATLSHEIRTPLNGVIGMTDLLAQSRLSREQRDYLETIRLSGDTLLTLINDILDFSKIESGRMELEDAPLLVCDLIEQCFELIGDRAREKRLELVYVVAPEVPVAIFGDITRLRQVLLNLVSNAVKFTEAGTVRVDVTAVPQESSNATGITLEWMVTDTGIGIAPALHERLFEPFTQADTTTTRRYGGTGLGLAISRRLVELMQGEIGVSSELKRGSRFFFTLPTRPATMVDGWIESRQPDVAGRSIQVIGAPGASRDSLTNVLRNWQLDVTTHVSVEAYLEGGFATRGAPPFSEARTMVLLTPSSLVEGRVWLDQLLAVRIEWNLAPMVMAYDSQADYDALNPVPMGAVSAWLMKPMRRRPLLAALLASDESNFGGSFSTNLVDSLATLDLSQSLSTSGSRSVGRNRGKSGASTGNLVRGADGSLVETDRRSPTRERQQRLRQLFLHKRVLIAEDNDVNQKIARAMLERIGVNAVVVENGLLACEHVQAGGIDIVLMDIHMPEMDGLTATKRIIATVAQKHRPWIVAVTANAMVGDRAMCLQAGMDDYVAKPLQFVSFLDAMERAATRTRPIDAMERTVLAPLSPSLMATASTPTLAFDAPAAAPAPLMVPLVSAVPNVVTGFDLSQLEKIPIIAHDQVGEILELDQAQPGTYRDFVRLFDAQLPERIAAIKLGVARATWPEVGGLAHALKGSSASLGAARFAQLCKVIEQAAKTGDAALVLAASIHLDTMHAQAMTAFEALAPVSKPANPPPLAA